MPPLKLTRADVDHLLGSDLIARLATIDENGYPHITPLWFHWDGETIRMTSLRSKPHVSRIQHDPRVCVLVDHEDAERPDGERPNRQVRFIGDATLTDDQDGHWTRMITHRYLTGSGASAVSDRRAAGDRVVIALKPARTIRVGSVTPTSDRDKS